MQTVQHLDTFDISGISIVILLFLLLVSLVIFIAKKYYLMRKKMEKNYFKQVWGVSKGVLKKKASKAAPISMDNLKSEYRFSIRNYQLIW